MDGDSPVRIIVKAPNQKIEDHIVESSLNWSVLKLKTHLSEIYPNKPRIKDQKLIYSGQLLHDHLTLKDILRQYDQSNTHIFHLVCTPSREALKAGKPNPPENRLQDTVPENSDNNTNEVPNASNTEGLRQRVPQLSTNNPPVPNTTAVPCSEFQSMYIPAYSMPPIPGVPLTPEQVAQQMLWMQQMYAHYMNQYMQTLQGGNFQQPASVNPSSSSNSTPSTGAQNAPPRQQNENIRMNAQGGPINDDDHEFGPNRDWLDWFYILSRAAVLFSIVYFYSSLSRLLAVTMMAAVFYIYKMGWFQMRRQQRRHLPPANPVPNIPLNPPENADVPNDDNNNRSQQNVEANEEQMRRETQEMENMMDNDIDNPVLPPEPGPSILNMTWSFVTGFFSSLIPEQPAQVV
uniref:Homocysteine-responsive endoplasmic reticulum-resident ubiquitin-like domain member 2 protein n=1 Tax=Scolopendra viridis TaxID=118503 RepID=A0A4D5R985_SCOVI